MGYIQERFGMMLLPKTKPGTCPMCGRVHEDDWPHDRDSLCYQYKFYDEHGRWPSWADAMAHCPEAVKTYWKAQLSARGIPLEESPETVTMNFQVGAGPNGSPSHIVTVEKEVKP